MQYYNNQPKVVVKNADIPEKLSVLSKLTQLNPYETNLVQSFTEFHDKKGYLTERQYELLNKLAEQYSEQKLNIIQSWRDSFTQEMRRDLNIICEYYKSTGYFQNIVNSWENNKDYIPTKEQFERITGNTYAKKVLASHKEPCVFNAGDLVCARSTLSHSSMKYANKNAMSVSFTDIKYAKILFVIENKLFIAGDANRYCKVFLMTNPECIVYIREKDLKRYRAGN
jgi:hypothetical protein